MAKRFGPPPGPSRPLGQLPEGSIPIGDVEVGELPDETLAEQIAVAIGEIPTQVDPAAGKSSDSQSQGKSSLLTVGPDAMQASPSLPTGKVRVNKRRVVLYPPRGTGPQQNANQEPDKWALYDESGTFLESFADADKAAAYMRHHDME